jgi:hypothetical protein
MYSSVSFGEDSVVVVESGTIYLSGAVFSMVRCSQPSLDSLQEIRLVLSIMDNL